VTSGDGVSLATPNGRQRGKRVEKLQIMVADAEVDMIDDWRFENRASSRSAAVRTLILLGLRYMQAHEEEAVRYLSANGEK